jgi:hypothetical protein
MQMLRNPWPWVSRAAHMREVTRMGEAYRWERDQALEEARAAKASRDRMLDALAHGSVIRPYIPDLTRDRKQIHVVLDLHPLLAHAPGEHMAHLAQRITMALSGFQRDYRPDMRDPHPERLALRA